MSNQDQNQNRTHNLSPSPRDKDQALQKNDPNRQDKSGKSTARPDDEEDEE